MDASESKLREHAKLAESITTIATVIMCLVTVAGEIYLPVVRSEGFRGGPEVMTPIVLERLVIVAPTMFYLFALFALAGVFRRIAAGEAFTARNGKGLAGVGADLMWGAAFAVLISPTLLAWIGNEHPGIDFHWQSAPTVIAIVGGALYILGGLLARAADLRRELDGFV